MTAVSVLRCVVWVSTGLALLLVPAEATAEPVLDRILSGAQIVEKGGCALLRIDFNIRIRYISHFPLDRGNQLSITIAAIDAAQARAELVSRREAAAAPGSKIAAIRSIDFEANAGTAPALLIGFKHPVSFKVAEGADFQSLIIAIAGPNAKPCAPVLGEAGGGGWATKVSPAALPPAVTGPGEAPVTGKLNDADRHAVSALMDRAREALGAGAADAAIKALTRVLAYPKTEVTQEASELLGVAYQRRGDTAKARELYDAYLRQYPKGDNAARVRDRLASLSTAAAAGGSAAKAAAGTAGKPFVRETRFGQPGQPAYIVSGSASQFYMRDDGFRNFVDPSLPPQINQAPDQHNTFQNELLSSLDLTAQWGDAATQSKFRFSGAEENGLTSGAAQIGSIAALELDTRVKAWGVTTKLGRQSRNTGGVLGRFDGGLISWDALPGVRFDTVAGAPVVFRRDLPFKNGAVFYGEAVDFANFLGPFDTTLFVIQQQNAGLIDRQAVGGEMRYADANKSAFAAIDYDTHFNRLGAAIVNGTWTLADKSTFTASAEHRTSPQLLASNALQGQTFGSLSDMLAVYSPDEVTQFAKDRTAYADTASVGFSRPLSEHLQVSLDASWFNVTETVTSAGVDANPSSGNEYYLSGQLIGNDLMKPQDLYVLGLRYATTPTTDTYVADLSARYPVSDKFRVNPRLRLAYRKGMPSEWEELSVLPSLRFNYQWTREFGLELESGAKFTEKRQAGTRDDQSEYFVTVGYRYDFGAEGAVVKMP